MSVFYDNSNFDYFGFYDTLSFSNYVRYGDPYWNGDVKKCVLYHEDRFYTGKTIKPIAYSSNYSYYETSFRYCPKPPVVHEVITSGASSDSRYINYEITNKALIFLKSSNILEMHAQLNELNNNQANEMAYGLSYDYFYTMDYDPTVNLMDFSDGANFDTNYVIVNGNTVYNNDKDGNISNKNKRNILYDNHILYFKNAYLNFSTRYLNDTPSYQRSDISYCPFSDIDYRIGPYSGTWSDIHNGANRAKQLNCHLLNAQFLGNSDFAVRYKIYGISTESYSDWQTRISGLTLTNSNWPDFWPQNIVLFVAWHKKDLEKFLLKFGVPFTFSKEEAESKNTSDFESPYVNPDDPVNPGSKAEGYPDNQKIELNIPKTSPSGGNGSIYILNPKQLNAVREGMWNQVIYQNFWGQGINPFDYVVGLWWYPFATSDLYLTQIKYKRVKLGSSFIMDYDVPGVDDEASINLLDGGKLHVPIMTDSYLDFEPYTSYTLYIPYVGFQSLSSQDILGKELSLKYFVNIYDGTLTAFLSANNQLIGTYQGVVGVKIPITNYDSRIQALQIYAQGQQMLSRASQVISGGVNAAANFGVFGPVGNVVNAGTNIASNTLSNIFDSNANKANQVINAVSNNYGMPYGLPGIYAPQTAYLKIETSLAQTPNLKISQEGKNSSISGTIKDLGLTGFVKTSSSTIIPASGEEYITEEEKMEIDRIMKGGVVING